MTYFIQKYFHKSEMYPAAKLTDILPEGVVWDYVSTSLLNGLVNYARHIRGWCLERYHKWEDELKDGDNIVNVREKGEWVKKKVLNYGELFNAATQPDAIAHANFSEHFKQDVVLLSKAENDPTLYVYFWFDHDKSDSCIGRFRSGDPKEEIIKAFDEHCAVLGGGYGTQIRHREIPLHYLCCGWISG